MVERELIVCLPRYRTYEARYGTFALAVAHGYRVRIALLHGPHPPADEYPCIEQIVLSDGLSLWSRGTFWRHWFTSLPWDRPTVLQDTFVAQMGLWRWAAPKARGRGPADVRAVLFLASPTPGFLFQGYWRLPSAVRMSWREACAEWRLQFPRVAMEWLSCRTVDGVLANSTQIAAEAAGYYGLPIAHCYAVPDAADTFFTPGPPRRDILGLREDEVILLYVGNRIRRKGIDVLIAILERLRCSEPRARLVMVGGAAERGDEWYRRLIGDADLASRITVVPHVSRETLREYYRAADVFLYPTRHEGSPRVVREALGSGCPVVCSDVPGIRMIDPGGQAVYYCADGRPDSYVQQVLRLLRDAPFRHARVIAAQRVLDELAPARTITRILSFYETLFARR